MSGLNPYLIQINFYLQVLFHIHTKQELSAKGKELFVNRTKLTRRKERLEVLESKLK